MPIGTRTSRSFSSVFNSSVPQRPSEKSAARAYGGRPLGPTTYTLPTCVTPWLDEPDRQTSVFSSKTVHRATTQPLTANLDFLGHAGQLSAQIGTAPGSRGLHWPAPPEPRELYRDPGLDEFCDTMSRSLASDISGSSRKYAASFISTTKRDSGPSGSGLGGETSPALGPGVYDLALSAVRVHDPKRSNYTFKSTTSSSLFGTPAGQPPDTVQSIQSAILSRHYTSKGVPFSTRERFPRQRAKWKD